MVDTCPFCKSDLRGNPIPEEWSGYYPARATHFSRLIGQEIRGVYDGILIWRCPDCGSMWPRFNNGPLHEKAHEIIRDWIGD